MYKDMGEDNTLIYISSTINQIYTPIVIYKSLTSRLNTPVQHIKQLNQIINGGSINLWGPFY